MKSIGIIPARYGSTRFPGKPLVTIKGKTMIRRVVEQALKSSSLSAVYVATDDHRIVSEVQSFSGNVLLTSSNHLTGTERCYEALELIGKDDIDVVVNIQGDEPFIHPENIDKVVRSFEDSDTEIATLALPVTNPGDLDNPFVVKIAAATTGRALYFSRAPIPHLREPGNEDRIKAYPYLKHIGIYAYRPEVLEKIVHLPPSLLEQAESLEQLRWLEAGFTIIVVITDKESFAIDTPEDLKKII